MKAIAYAILIATVVACGKDDSKNAEEDTSSYEVTRIDVDAKTYGSLGSTAYITLTTNLPSAGSTHAWKGVIVIVEGSTAPASCQAEGRASSSDKVLQIVDGLKASTTYSLRACLLDTDATKYSAGITKTFTTPAAT